ncbi:hypothetical protein RRG08_056660 [Elysia crispata]|uniref:Uncharacterized protein n=1 Tax=Elysia crispata TaxID=231223 RepID=A0AAE1CY71_9GAST|nr:hypothetical protein RRG08_056660 [Elysia crispata]
MVEICRRLCSLLRERTLTFQHQLKFQSLTSPATMSSSGSLNRSIKLVLTKRDNSVPAGITSDRGNIRFRYGLVMEMEPQSTNFYAKRWNYPYSRQFSSIPTLPLGFPFDTSKPRRGRWGEIPGTIISDASAPLEELWSEKLGVKQREEKALAEARADLQKRIEICLYGKIRDPPVLPRCVLGPDGVFRGAKQPYDNL